MKHIIVVEFRDGHLSELETAIQLKDWEYVTLLLASAQSIQVRMEEDPEPHRRG